MIPEYPGIFPAPSYNNAPGACFGLPVDAGTTAYSEDNCGESVEEKRRGLERINAPGMRSSQSYGRLIPQEGFQIHGVLSDKIAKADPYIHHWTDPPHGLQPHHPSHNGNHGSTSAIAE